MDGEPLEGQGSVSVDSQAFPRLPITWASRQVMADGMPGDRQPGGGGLSTDTLPCPSKRLQVHAASARRSLGGFR